MLTPHPPRTHAHKIGTVRLVSTACCERLEPVYAPYPALPDACPACKTSWHGRKRRMATVVAYARNAELHYDYESVF